MSSAEQPPLGELLRRELAEVAVSDPQAATRVTALLLERARQSRASDVHLDPDPAGLLVRLRIDGVLHEVGRVPTLLAPRVVARLKVLAELLTYRTDAPQEGRIRTLPGEPETRVSTLPSLHGERAVIRLFAGSGQFQRLEELDLGPVARVILEAALKETGGLIVLSGPAGSGKTTTFYACLRALAQASQGSRSLLTLEDPIEVAVPGVVQAQVNPAAGFTLESGLKSLLRQDPEVIGVGEIRDPGTAALAVQAALTGHLVVTTFHAGSAAEALSRLADMGIEPYMLRSCVRTVLSQRLSRRLCACAREAQVPAELLGLPVARARVSVGCAQCAQTGYLGRTPIVEAISPRSGPLAEALQQRADVATLERQAREAGFPDRWADGLRRVTEGLTSPAELRRVLGST